jgi:hypothetical protein
MPFPHLQEQLWLQTHLWERVNYHYPGPSQLHPYGVRMQPATDFSTNFGPWEAFSCTCNWCDGKLHCFKLFLYDAENHPAAEPAMGQLHIYLNGLQEDLSNATWTNVLYHNPRVEDDYTFLVWCFLP